MTTYTVTGKRNKKIDPLAEEEEETEEPQEPQDDEEEQNVFNMMDQEEKVKEDEEVSSPYYFDSGSARDPNLIKVQIEYDELLSKLEHFYRGDHLAPNAKGKLVWFKQTNKNLITLNEYGVSSIMSILNKYLHKGIALSKYSEERIYEVIASLGNEINTFLMCNYEKMGMDTEFKRQKYGIIIVTTLQVIEAAFRRSIGGDTFDKLNQSNLVKQSDEINNPLQTRPGFVTRIRKGLLGI